MLGKGAGNGDTNTISCKERVDKSTVGGGAPPKCFIKDKKRKQGHRGYLTLLHS